MEFVAGLLVAVAAVAFVLEPLLRRPPRTRNAPSDGAPP